MLYKKPQPSLLKNAYADFERRFKWNWYFETEGKGKSDPYDPDYDLKEASDTPPPQPPDYIRKGLEAGSSLIAAFSAQYELPYAAKHRPSRLVWLAELKGFLDEHDYVITLTDKNLGAAVVKRDWLKAGACKLLSDVNNYQRVDEARVETAVDKIRDMLLYVDPVTNQVNHKPYKKPLNHLERNPWASHHPLDVKRGTFIGELSRLATLSSKLFHYLDAIKELKLLYLCRGYPMNSIERWSKDHAKKRWQNRLEETVQDAGDLFVLKSSFNPLWEDLDVKSLFATIKKSWVENLPRIDRCNLEGRCSLHNSSTMQHTIPFNLRVAEKKRLDASEFKHTLLQNVHSLVDTQTPGASGSSGSLHQETLGRFWTGHPSGSRGRSLIEACHTRV
jgi:hypothetical protein